MAKVIMICGKLCCGKTTYARSMIGKGNAVLLSIDEIMLMMFGQHCGDMHEEYAARTEKYLLDKAVEIIKAGTDVVLDWGFWRKEQRTRVKEFFRSNGILCEMHYIEVSPDIWQRRIAKRNAGVLEGTENAYYVDGNLARKFENLFEYPDDGEIDLYYPEN